MKSERCHYNILYQKEFSVTYNPKVVVFGSLGTNNFLTNTKKSETFVLKKTEKRFINARCHGNIDSYPFNRQFIPCVTENDNYCHNEKM